MSEVFDVYALYYDLLYKDKDYLSESEYIVNLMKEYKPTAEKILELGCGTGAHASYFAEMGFYVHGVDKSEAMLEKAIIRKSALSSDTNARLTFASGDIRTYRTEQTFDVVLSLFHVFSYQTTNEDLIKTFQTAAAHLNPGGILIFDFWYGPAVLTQRPEIRVKRLEDEKIRITRIAEPVLKVNENVVDVNYTMFVEDKSTREIAQMQELHKMRYLFLPEIEMIVADLFSSQKIVSWMTGRHPIVDDWGVVSVMRRN